MMGNSNKIDKHSNKEAELYLAPLCKATKAMSFGFIYRYGEDELPGDRSS